MSSQTPVVNEVFGRMLSGSQIEDQVNIALRKWFPTYLHEVERQMGLPVDTFDIPENYTDRNRFDMEAPEQLPKIVVIAPGTVGPPLKKGTGVYDATWRIGIGVAVGAETEQESNTLCKGFGAAVRGIMLQNSGLNVIGCIDIIWTDESHDDVPVPNRVQLVKAASLYFNATFAAVVRRGGGPRVPDQPTYEILDFETADIEIDLEAKPIG